MADGDGDRLRGAVAVGLDITPESVMSRGEAPGASPLNATPATCDDWSLTSSAASSKPLKCPNAGCVSVWVAEPGPAGPWSPLGPWIPGAPWDA